jgi:hypothetical protein
VENPLAKSIHLSQISPISEALMGPGEMGDAKEAVTAADFEGIETNFARETLDKRKIRIF